MKVNRFILTAAALMSSVSLSSAMVNIEIEFDDIGEGGVGGSGFTDAQAQVFFEAEATWESILVDYADGATGPSAIVITVSAPAIDGAGGILGQAGPRDVITSEGVVYAETGIMQFDSADVNALEASGDFAGVILHEMAHVLGIGTLWQANGIYQNDTFEYTGENALARYQRDFDPDATFIPIENDGGPGTANGHWEEDTDLVGINPDTPYFGELFNDEILTGFATGSLFISDVTIGAFEDLGYQVNYFVDDFDELFWDAGDTSANGSVDPGDGVWDASNSNWTVEDGSVNGPFADRASANFTGTGSAITIDGVVLPAVLNFEVDGYSLSGGTIDITAEGSSIVVTNAADTATFNTTIMGAGTLSLEGEGTVANEGSILSNINVTSGTLTSVGDGLGDTITLSNFSNIELLGDDTIASYESTGGQLSGAGILTASTYTLRDGAVVNGSLGAGVLEVVSGDVTLTGSSAAETINITAGNLLVSENGLNSAASVNNSGALILNGDLRVGGYTATDGTVRGNGILTTDSFSGGTIQTNATGVSQLSLLIDANGGEVTLGSGSQLDFSVVDPSNLEVVNIYPLISNFSDITGEGAASGFETFTSSNLPSGTRGVFDVNSGLLFVTSIEGAGSSANTAAVANGIFGGEFAEGQSFANVDGFGGNTVAILNEAQRLANLSPTDGITFASQLRELSPEVYGSVIDYGVKTHLNYLDTGLSTTNVLRNGKMRVFAGVSGFDIESDSSRDDADYSIQSTGGYIGVAQDFSSSVRLGVMAAAETGEISASRLDLDGDGQMIALFAEREFNSPVGGSLGWGRLRGSVSYSSHSFDGSRRAQGMRNSVGDIDSDVFQIGVDYKAELFGNAKYKISPTIGVRYVTSSSDAFTERGSLNNLSVDDIEKDSLLLEYGLDGRWMPTASNWGFTGAVKAQHTFIDDEADIDARFAGSPTSFSVTSEGINSFNVEASAGMFFQLGKSKHLRFSGFTNFGEDYDSSVGGNVHFEIEW